MKRLMTIAVLVLTLLAAPLAQAASYQDRVIANGAVIGTATGAVVGASQNQPVEGALFGAVLGTIAGAIIASQIEPAYAVEYHPAPHYREQRYEYREHPSRQGFHDARRHEHRQTSYGR
jgi:uncharacterized membrane protein